MQGTEEIWLQNSTAPSINDSFRENDLSHKIVVTLSAGLSLCGASVIIGTFIAWEDFRSVSRKILVYISIADFLIAAGNLLGFWIHHAQLSSKNDFFDKLCEGQSFVTTTASLWSFFWTVYLAIFLYMVVVKKQRMIAEKSMTIFHFFAWGIPLALVGTALGFQKLSTRPDSIYTSGWCWVPPDLGSSDQALWILVLGKAWEIAAYVLIFVFYFTLKYHIRKVLYNTGHLQSQNSVENAWKAEKRLTFVPVVFVLLRIWGTIRFFLYTYGGLIRSSGFTRVLLYLHGIGDNSQGSANFLLFCLFTERFQSHVNNFAHSVVFNCREACSYSKAKSVRFQDEEEMICSTQETRLIEKDDSHKTYEAC